jgi:hypothetical protein
MARGFIVKGPDDEFIAAGDDLQELIKNIEEQEGLADDDDLADRYDF